MPIISKIQDLHLIDFHFTPFEDNSRLKFQKMSHIQFKCNPLLVQTPLIIIESFGIPKEGQFYPDAKSRAFIKLPFCFDRKKYPDDVDYDAIEQFYNKLVEIDMYCDTEEFRQKVFGDSSNKYRYQPIVRNSYKNDDDEEIVIEKNGSGLYTPSYAKIKLELDYDTSQPKFKLFTKLANVRKEIDMKSFDDVVENIKYLTKLRMILSFSKLYAMKTTSGNEKKLYGIVLKATHIEVNNKNKELPTETDVFMDD